MIQRIILLVLTCSLAIVSLSLGQSIVLEVDKDAFICDCASDANNPGGPLTNLFQGPYYVGGHQCYARTASSWDISSLPVGCNISQAKIEFKCSSTWGTLTGQMVFYRFLQSWGETTITNNNLPPHTSQDSIIQSWPSAGQWLSIDVTNIVRFWYEHPDSNFGIYGYCANTTSQNGAAAFYSSRYATGSDRPKLTINYTPTDVRSQGTLIPSDFRLEAYPNPFNPSTSISYKLNKAGRVSLNIVDISGRIVDRLVDTYQSSGEHHLLWDASRFSSGIYLVTLTAETKRATVKLALMK
jgi:hypothetical protein